MEREFSFTEQDFAAISSRVYGYVGIQLPAQKKDMVYGRLSRRLRKLGLNDFQQYLELLDDDGNGELENMVNAITTNVTAFFREPHHFQHLADEVIPFLLKHNASTRRMRFWSAGCSAGMEAYSMALTLCAHVPNRTQWDIKILATDVDTTVIEQGRKAEYDEAQLEKIPPNYARQYVEHDPRAGVIRMKPEVKALVHFKRLNLHEEWPMRGPFDVIFCRNVVIYFDKPTQRVLFNRYADMLRPEGWLYIGHSENLHHVCDRFELLGNTIYRKVS